MATWNSRGLRGSTLEEFINRTNEKYLDSGLALIQKVPTPITPIRIDKETRHITLAYFDQKSTVDYIGAVQGIPVCFDAKECMPIRFRFKISTSTRLRLWKILKSRAGRIFSDQLYEPRYILLSASRKAFGILEQGERGRPQKLSL